MKYQCPSKLTDSSTHAIRAASLMRAALQREFESELRGLIMAARMHGFQLSVQGENMAYHAIDTRQLPPSGTKLI